MAFFLDDLIDGYRSAQGMATCLQKRREEGIELGGSNVPGEVLDEIERQLSWRRQYRPTVRAGHFLYSVLHPLQTLRDSYDRTESIMNEGRPI